MWLTEVRRRWFGKLGSRGRVARPRSGLPRVRQLEGRLTPSLTSLASFVAPDGIHPQAGLIMDGSGNLYGTAENGGAFNDGTVFEVAHGSRAITALASLNGTDGAHPQGALIMDGSGNLYGTAADGGASGDGTIFELPHGSGTITTLASFDGADGANPLAALLMDANGNLYGTTARGGADRNHGTVFELAAGSGTITTLASFDGTDGAQPSGALIMDGRGNFYGTTSAGGPSAGGTVFELAQSSAKVTTLASFSSQDGTGPLGKLVMDGSGDLYGTLYGDGFINLGVVFEVVHGSGTATTLASFNGSDGDNPGADLVMDAGGNLYGTTVGGGPGRSNGTVFELAQGSHTITTLASFNDPAGAYPRGGVIMDGNGNLYGTTGRAGDWHDGTVFELAQGSGTITTLASFTGTNGQLPYSGLIMDSHGNLYGTTSAGGASSNGKHVSGDGTVFELAKGSDTITTLASFNGTNGRAPTTGLLMDSRGNLYGTTFYGGASDDGTVFELASGSGTITTLVSFNGTDGRNPDGALIMDSSGNLYGTTGAGAGSSDGTVFELVPSSGALTTLASFNLTNGGGPEGALIMDAGGNLYGTTILGGAGGGDGYGTVFELVHGSSTITTLASFNGNNGAYPSAGLRMDSSGNLYGVTGFGGPGWNPQAGQYGDGTVFEVARDSGTITTLATFSGSGSQGPIGPPIMDGSGNLYGATVGARGQDGTLFELAQGASTITTLASFNGLNGAGPTGAMAVDSSGNLYGTAGGGAAGLGSVFELTGAIQSDQWTGANSAVDTNWSDGGNWSLGAPPTAGQTVLFTNDSSVKSFTATVDAGFTNAIGGLVIDSSWGGTITVSSALSVTGNMTLASGTFGGGGAVTIAGRASLWTGGQIVVGSGGVTNTGTLNIDTTAGSLVLTGPGTLTNTGTINEAGTNLVILKKAATLSNAAGATFDLTDNGSVSQSGGSTFANAGTLEKTGGTGTSTIATKSLDNTGTVEVTSGTLDISATVSQVSGRTLTGGSWTVLGSPTVHANLDIVSAGHFTTLGSGATVTLSGTTVAFPNLTSLSTINAGATLSLQAGQSRTTVGALTNAGNLVLGAGTKLTVSGSFTQTPTGKLTIKVGGTHAAPTFGQLVSTTGTVALGGSLSVGSTSLPAVGTSFEVLDNEGSSAIGGIFKGLSEGATFKVKRGTTTMTFQITYAGTDSDGDENVIITRIS
jgi:uncharacterized repeat protein (TIGR03803 family)